MRNTIFAAGQKFEGQLEPRSSVGRLRVTANELRDSASTHPSLSFPERSARPAESLLQISSFCKTLQTFQSTIAKSVVPGRRQMRTCRAWNDEMATDNITETARPPATKGFQRTDEEAASFLRKIGRAHV